MTATLERRTSKGQRVLTVLAYHSVERKVLFRPTKWNVTFRQPLLFCLSYYSLVRDPSIPYFLLLLLGRQTFTTLFPLFLFAESSTSLSPLLSYLLDTCYCISLLPFFLPLQLQFLLPALSIFLLRFDLSYLSIFTLARRTFR